MRILLTAILMLLPVLPAAAQDYAPGYTAGPSYNFYGPTTNYFGGALMPQPGYGPQPYPVYGPPAYDGGYGGAAYYGGDYYSGGYDDGARLDPWHGYSNPDYNPY